MESQIVDEIKRSQLNEKSNSEATITAVEHVASYNWIDKEKPTILVPGKFYGLNDI
jgi:hypothetical protein